MLTRDEVVLAHFQFAKDRDAHLYGNQGEVVYQLTQADLLQAARTMLDTTGAAQLSAALADIAAERRRQIEAEGWTPEHDDAYRQGHLADAAACYALCAHDTGAKRSIPAWWPWRNEWWKPSTTRRDLVKAGALIAAEIERLDRAEQKGGAA